MSIAITDDHRALADTANDFLLKHNARAAARALLEAPSERLPELWDDLRALGWLGLHVPEQYGGSGNGMGELGVGGGEPGGPLPPGPFLPTVVASAVIAASGSDELKSKHLPGL